MKRPCLVTIWTWKWYKNGENDTKSKKKRSFWRSTIFDHLPPCGFVNFINFIKTPLYFFFLGTTLHAPLKHCKHPPKCHAPPKHFKLLQKCHTNSKHFKRPPKCHAPPKHFKRPPKMSHQFKTLQAPSKMPRPSKTL